jgi:hypothetical protein
MTTHDPDPREPPGVGTSDDGSATTLADVAEPATPASRRIKLFLEPEEVPWLPVSEPAFLLWVLAMFVLIWVGIAVALRLS